MKKEQRRATQFAPKRESNRPYFKKGIQKMKRATSYLALSTFILCLGAAVWCAEEKAEKTAEEQEERLAKMLEKYPEADLNGDKKLDREEFRNLRKNMEDLTGQRQQESKKPNPAFAPIKDDPDLPRVLILGDSISIGYTVAVREELKGIANLHRPAANCGPSSKGVEAIDEWLGDGKWDVIHFNWGLHDLKYAPGTSPENGDPIATPIPDYKKNLDIIVTRMKKTGAKLIFATTTPYPDGVSPIRLPKDCILYNDAACEIMKKHEVAIDDLYAFTLPKLEEIQNPVNVHFSPEGSKTIAKQVAKTIIEALK